VHNFQSNLESLYKPEVTKDKRLLVKQTLIDYMHMPQYIVKHTTYKYYSCQSYMYTDNGAVFI